MTPRTYEGSFDGVVAWLDQILIDQTRALKTSLLLAIDRGELDAEDDIDVIVEAAMLSNIARRDEVLQRVLTALKGQNDRNIRGDSRQ